MKVLIANFYTLKSFEDEKLWAGVISNFEELLETKITHLDSVDPCRKKLISVDDAAKLISTFDGKEKSRYIFSRCSNKSYNLTIQHYRNDLRFCNSISISLKVPDEIAPNDVRNIKLLFDQVCAVIEPFYAFIDYEDFLQTKRKKNGFAIDLRCELTGVFWLTFFNDAYSQFLRLEKRDSLKGLVARKPAGGVCLELTDLPNSNDLVKTRFKVQSLINENVFVVPDSEQEKEIGEFVISYEKLRSALLN